MIDTQDFITDAQLLAAFESGPMKMQLPDRLTTGSRLTAGAESCRRVAEFAIAAYINATLPEKLEQLDRVTAAVERYTGEVLS